MNNILIAKDVAWKDLTLAVQLALNQLELVVRTVLAPIDALRTAYLFGSQVSGRTRPGSDLDLAVAYQRGLDVWQREQVRRRIVGVLTDALGVLGERTDVVDLERAGSAIAFSAIRARRNVLARDESERVNIEVRICRRYEDDAPQRALFETAAIAVSLSKHGEP